MPSPTCSPTATRDLELRIGVSRKVRRRATEHPGIPETTVLRRWRRLTMTATDGSTYHGCRLPPSLWHMVGAAISRDPRAIDMPVAQFAAHVADVRAAARVGDTHWGSVPADALLALLKYLRRTRRLAPILAAHAEAARYGVPDLLLYRKRGDTYCDFRFVEVKRHDERLRADQLAELHLLRSLRLCAGIVRLEKPAADPTLTPTRHVRAGQPTSDALHGEA